MKSEKISDEKEEYNITNFADILYFTKYTKFDTPIERKKYKFLIKNMGKKLNITSHNNSKYITTHESNPLKEFGLLTTITNQEIEI